MTSLLDDLARHNRSLKQQFATQQEEIRMLKERLTLQQREHHQQLASMREAMRAAAAQRSELAELRTANARLAAQQLAAQHQVEVLQEMLDDEEATGRSLHTMLLATRRERDEQSSMREGVLSQYAATVDMLADARHELQELSLQQRPPPASASAAVGEGTAPQLRASRAQVKRLKEQVKKQAAALREAADAHAALERVVAHGKQRVAAAAAAARPKQLLQPSGRKANRSAESSLFSAATASSQTFVSAPTDARGRVSALPQQENKAAKKPPASKSKSKGIAINPLLGVGHVLGRGALKGLRAPKIKVNGRGGAQKR